MWRTIKKWWILRCLAREIDRHTLKEPLHRIAAGGTVLLTQEFFIVGTEDHPGLANRSVRRFSKVLWWRKKYNPEKLKRRVKEYNDLVKECIDEGYITMSPTNGVPMPIPTHAAGDIHGWFGLAEFLLKKYSGVQAFLFGGGLAAVFGLIWWIIAHT